MIPRQAGEGVGVIRVILIDDHQLMRAGVRLMIEAAPDVEVVGEAAKAQEGLELIATCECDLVVADFNLPDYEAPWLLTQLRKRQLSVPLLMLSQYTEGEKIRQIMSLGASGYVVKTATREEFLTAVQVVASGGIYVHPAVASALLSQPATQSPLLSSREFAILQLLMEGLSNPAIAGRLHVALATVKADMQNLFVKLGVKDRTRLVATALARGLIRLPEQH